MEMVNRPFKKQFYKTKDFWETSILIASGIPLVKVSKGKPCFFYFKENERTIALTEAFWRGDFMVNARALVDSQRRVKDIIFGGKSAY